ncbi:MAG TPA: choice-of-anchor Q domain-containing protein [Actinomycetota bacterium]|nr:choice-of-anchor Q domain-containing protein [Actinomycetota bacterium]
MTKGKSATTSLLLIVAVASHMFVSAAPAAAESISVDEDEDEFNSDGDCSLREALEAANTNAAIDDCPAGSSTETDDILLDADRYELSRTTGPANTFGSLDASTDIRISGAGVNESIIDANGIDRAFFATGGMDADVFLNYFQITGGELTGGSGAGILNQADLQLNNMLITNNQVIGNTGSDYGGGISTVAGFRARIKESVFSFNASHLGAGVDNAGGTTSVEDSLIWFNTAGEGGGGLYNGGTATLSNVTISDNLAGSSGGGIYNQVNSELTVKNATVFDNKAGSGFPSNIAHQGTSIEVSNTIVGKPSSGINCGGTITSSGHNLSSDDTCDFDLGSDLENRNPRLRDLADNGGRTSTHALKPSSPAVNTGAGNLGRDQRGVPRPQGGRPDIGAYELAFCSGTVVNVVGTRFSDVLVGHPYKDGILGLGSDDVLKGGEGPDRLCGGTGPDRLKGGDGDDKLLGQKGDDVHSGGPGTDVCKGGPGTDSATSCEHTTGIP